MSGGGDVPLGPLLVWPHAPGPIGPPIVCVCVFVCVCVCVRVRVRVRVCVCMWARASR